MVHDELILSRSRLFGNSSKRNGCDFTERFFLAAKSGFIFSLYGTKKFDKRKPGEYNAVVSTVLVA